jgi:hypothetical protein
MRVLGLGCAAAWCILTEAEWIVVDGQLENETEDWRAAVSGPRPAPEGIKGFGEEFWGLLGGAALRTGLEQGKRKYKGGN